MRGRKVVDIVGETDVGRIRPHNEDAIDWDVRTGVAIVADGMGGHRAGDVASRTAVRHIKSELRRALALWGQDAREERALAEAASLLKGAVEKANEAVYQTGLSRPECAGMGTTVVVALFLGEFVTIGHVGDSRLYRLRDAQIERLTQDHSLVYELVRDGYLTEEQARLSEYKNVITRALGAEQGVEVDIQQQRTAEGDIYLLCTDGLTGLVSDTEIEMNIRSFGRDTAGTAHELIRLANEKGGHDNISVVLVRIDDPATNGHSSDQQMPGV
jgi:serine/threonine protein phosphatase PrpC